MTDLEVQVGASRVPGGTHLAKTGTRFDAVTDLDID